jgi:hypothetical protein
MDSRYTVIQDEDARPSLDNLLTSTSITKKAVSNKQCWAVWTHTYLHQGGDIQAPRQSPQRPSSRRNVKDSSTYASISTGTLGDYDTDEGKQPSESTEGLTGGQPRDLLPRVDIGSGTKFQCLLAICLGIGCFLACIICSIGFWAPFKRPPLLYLPDGLPGEAISFIVNLILTQCLEGLAYVHSVSLRWALLRENRLVFNTNIRLFTSSRLSQPNSWYINSISATLLILCYGATSILVMPRVNSEEGTYDKTYLNLIALLTLGLALFGQTLLAIWCYYNNLRDIPSWSSNPLNTTVTMLKQQFVQHRDGRCINSVQIPDMSEARPMPSCMRQPSQWQICTYARHAVKFTWILVGLSFIWFLTIILLTRSNMMGAFSTIRSMGGDPLINSTWRFSLAWTPLTNPDIEPITYTTYFNAVFFSLDSSERTGSGPSMSFVAALIVSLLFVCAVQGLQTLGLHCAELIINSSRDEDVWRALDAQNRSDAKSHVLSTPPFLAALLSWKYDMLVIFKSLLHWLLGQSIQPSFSFGNGDRNVWFTMNYARLFVYVICAFIFASFITFLAFMRPRGPQPATYGHIQTIADVVDDWALDRNGRFWWGDKGCREGVRHAGMSSQKKDLGPIWKGALYAGKFSSRSFGSTKLRTNQEDMKKR